MVIVAAAQAKGEKVKEESPTDIVRRYTIARWGEDEWASMEILGGKESGFRPFAVNPTSGARGIPQALPCSKLLSVIGTLDNIEGQAQWMVDYIARRYSSPSQALAFHRQHNWY